MRRDLVPTPRSGRRAFTLAELLVALVLVAVGLLALAGGVGQTLRAASRAESDAQAAALLAARVERIAASPCVDTSGTAVSRGRVERWRTWTADSLRWLADSVRWRVAGDSTRFAALTVPVRCLP